MIHTVRSQQRDRFPVLAALALLLCAEPVAAAGGATPDEAPATCRAVPEVVLEPGQGLLVGGWSFELDARPDEAVPATRLALDLMIRGVDPRSRRARVGSYQPGLRVTYTMTDGSPGGPTTGELAFRRASQGPSYGTDVVLEERQRGERLRLSVTIDHRARFTPRPWLDGGDCPVLPLSLTFVVDPQNLQSQAGPAASLRAPADDVHMELLGTLDPRPAESYSDIWGYSAGGTELAIMGVSSGTLFIDVTDPTSPQEVGFVAGPGSPWRDIKTYQHYAYMVTEGFGSGQGLQIVDLSDPGLPVVTYDETFTTAHNIFIDQAKGHAWIVGSDNGTRILDLSQDPLDPVEIGSWSDRYVHDIFVAGDHAYLSEISNGLHEIADSSDPANLQILSSWPTPGLATHNSWTNEAGTILATTDETTGGHVAVYDISDKTQPAPLLGEYAPDSSAVVHNVVVDDEDDERIAISHYNLGLKYVDLHRPGMPVELGSYDTRPNVDSGGGGAWGVYPFDSRGYIYVSDIQTGLYVFRHAPSGGTLSGVVRNAADDTPIADARVMLLSSGVEVVSGRDGVFALYAPEGNVQLRVSSPGFRTSIANPGSMPLGGRVDADVMLDPLPRVALSGVVRRAGDLGGVAGASVGVAGTSLLTTSAADGSYLFPEVVIGQQTLTVEAFGFASAERTTVLAPGLSGAVDFLLEPGAFVDDAEVDRGWSFGVPGDTALSGQWVRVDPNGTGGGFVQPETDHTPDPGALAFITGQSAPGASVEDNDVDGGWTTLLSPVIDVAGLGAARLRYHRWVSNAAGQILGGSLRVQVAEDGETFKTVELESNNISSWDRREFDLGSFVSLTDGLRVRFRAEAITGLPDDLRVLECGIDDFDVVQSCLSRFSPENGDGDRDGTVDVCDACPGDAANDVDLDGVCGDADNAPFTTNPDQSDGDGDLVGDAADNCPALSNPGQRDLDRDGLGDACDEDLDGDGLPDALDDDRDDDGVVDASDLCPTVPGAHQPDNDDDGEGDACDADDGTVQGVRLSGTLIRWEPETGSDAYNLYRGDLGSPALLPLSACRVTGVVGNFYVDPDLPVPGEGFLYVVSRVIGEVEDSLGFDSGGASRQVVSPCP